jgi:hypothetical protein
MLKRNAVLAALVALAPLSPAVAQSSGAVVVLNVQKPKAGMGEKYEAARKKHMAWHKTQKDTWTWYTWEVVSGEGMGQYLTASFGHAWKDFDGRDKFEADDEADLRKGVIPTLEATHLSYYVRRADLSLSQPSPTGPSAYSVLTYFLLKPEGQNDFIEAVKKVNEGIKKTSYPLAGPSQWYQLVNGGEGPLFVLAAGRANWEAFAPNEKTLDAMMEEAYGKEQGAAILASARKATRSSRTETVKYRPDLSYVPAAKETANR